MRSVTGRSFPLSSVNVPLRAASAWSSAFSQPAWSSEATACMTASISAAVWPRAPARAIARASVMLAGEKTNVGFSPASITLALAMARAGARGQTAAEMDAVMHAVASDDHAGWLNALDQALAGRSGTFKDESGKDLQVTLRIANAPFAQQGMPLEKAYLEALAGRYGAGLRLVDYATQTEKARTLINGWVDAQTEHRIPELLVPGVLTPKTRLTLVNAIYLKAPWQTPFSADATKAGAFTRADGSTVQVPFMAMTASLRFASGDGSVSYTHL